MNSAKLYSRFNTYQQALNATAISKKLHLLKFQPGENLFEVGCGNGGSTRTVLQHIPHTYNKFIATDKLTDMVNQARSENTNNVHFDQLDITDERIKKEWTHSFNKIFSFFAIQWAKKDQQCHVFKNLNKLLKVNGSIFITMVADSPVYDTYQGMYDIPRWAPYMENKTEFLSCYSSVHKDRMKLLETIFKEAMFEPTDVDFMDIDYNFEDVEDCKNTIKAINPFILRMPKDLHEEYWEDLWKVLDKQCAVLKTGELPTNILFINAKKIKHVD